MLTHVLVCIERGIILNKIKDVNIKDLFPSYVYERGLTYYKQNRVHDLSYDLNYGVWTAIVAGKNETYLVEVDLKKAPKEPVRVYCDCPAHAAYGPCKHIAAVLLGIQDRESRKQNTQPAYQFTETNQFIRAITSLQQQESPIEIIQNKIPIYIEYYCHIIYGNKLGIEMKAGPKRLYVVKDMENFLRAVLTNQEYFFTKTFTYSPEQHYILSKDLEVFRKLYDIIQNSRIYGRDEFYRGDVDERRYTLIPPLVTEELFTMLMERNFLMKKNQPNYMGEVVIKQGELPFTYALTEGENDELILHIEDVSHLEFLPDYDLLKDNTVFYILQKDQVPIINVIMYYWNTNEKLPIAKEQADTFISEVLPSLEKIGQVDISEKVASEIVQVPLVAKLFLEIKEGMILGNLEYHYGNETVDPFGQTAEKDTIIVRDVHKEQKIMQLIEHSDFHYNGRELYIEPNEAELYDFLYHMLPVLDDYVELFLTSELRSMMMEQDIRPDTNVRVESSTNLLEIGFELDGVDDGEIQHILQAVIEKKRYYRMQTGKLMSLEGEEFSSIQQFFSDLNIKETDMQDGNIKMPVYRGIQVDELIETNKIYDTSFRKLLQHLKTPEQQVYEVPDQLHANLRNYQMAGFQWFKSLSEYHLGGILADDMGLGKTLQSIAYLVSEPSDKPHLIVVPSSVVYNWKNELAKFAPSLSVTVLTGNPRERHERMEKADNIDVWITSYATLRQDIAHYRELSFHVLILDEAQYIKNYATKTSKAMREIQANRKFALSGTPIENSIDELWAIFQVVLPGLMPNRKTFRQLEHDKIATLTKPFILRRLKSDVLKELPEKIESVYVSELTKEQKELYIAYLQQLQKETAQTLKENSFQQNRMKILAGLTRLRQLCCHPALFIENYTGKSGKLEQLMQTVRSAIENGKRMLIFSQFTSMHEMIAKVLEKEEIAYFYLHGQTPSKERVEMSERFNNGEKSVFLISLKAGGTGLNLTGADTVILYDLWWNPAVEDQATGRAHRFGQKNTVQVIRLIAEGTIEEKIYELQQKKRELIDKVIQPGETMLSSLSEKDIRELLSMS